MTTPRRVHLYACPSHGMIATPRKLTHCVVCRAIVKQAHAADLQLPFGAVVDKYRRAFWREESRAREERKRAARKESA